MLLFKKKDLLVVISKSGETVQFTKPLKDILKYQHRYNYKFKMYENGKVTVADDYIIEGETLTVLFGSATVTYTSEGATYTEGTGGSGGGSTEDVNFIIFKYNYITESWSCNKTFSEIVSIIENEEPFIAYVNTNENSFVLNNLYIMPEQINFYTDMYSYANRTDSTVDLVNYHFVLGIVATNSIVEHSSENIATVLLGR